MSETGWRKCGPCKKMIPYNSVYYVCNVSTCRKQVFCSHNCWRAHVPVMRHKDAWAEEERSPEKGEENPRENTHAEPEPRRERRFVASQTGPVLSGQEIPDDVLVIASKLKQYIRLKSGFNTSASALTALSDLIRSHCDSAMDEARRDGRKTVMDRDFTSPR